MSTDDYIDVYRRYLSKFEELFGDIEFNETVRYRSRLIKKLRYDEFVQTWTEYKQIERFMREMMTKGATMDDEVNRTYQDLSHHVLQNPKDFLTI
jgi:hypothetical protein